MNSPHPYVVPKRPEKLCRWKARFRSKLLDDANTMGVDLALIRGDDVEEEWEYLEEMVNSAALRLQEKGKEPARSKTGKLLRVPRRRRKTKD